MDSFRDPCLGCAYPSQVIPPCPNLNWSSPRVVLVAQAPGSGALCSKHVCRYNHLFKLDDGTAAIVDWALSRLGVSDQDLLSLNALRCASYANCYHVTHKAEETNRPSQEYARCQWSLKTNLAPHVPKAILLAGEEAWKSFYRAFNGHRQVEGVRALSWEETADFEASSVTRLAHPGGLGMNARIRRLRRTEPDALTARPFVFLRDLKAALDHRFPGEFEPRPNVSDWRAFKEERLRQPHPYPNCECQSEGILKLHPHRTSLTAP